MTTRKPSKAALAMRMKMLSIYGECADRGVELPSRSALCKLLDRRSMRSVVEAHRWLIANGHITEAIVGDCFHVTIVSTGKVVMWKGKLVQPPKPEVTGGRRCLCCQDMFMPAFRMNYICQKCSDRNDHLPIQFLYSDPGA